MSRTLRLRREVLAELTEAELGAVGGAAEAPSIETFLQTLVVSLVVSCYVAGRCAGQP